ncbi:DUF4097 domain-containing protein [Clostridia bacterium OttesenSCG-928-F22]|nr:DUF4097 domain-containing protein [Clostridia bacterium OttesenSCG-928-F22]
MKIKKWPLIVAGALLLAGAICLSVAFSMGGFELENILRQQPKELQTVQYASGTVTLVDVQENIDDIIVVASPDDKIHLSYYTNEDEYYEITQTQEGVLSIRSKAGAQWYDFIKWLARYSKNKTPITIALPTEYAGSLRLHSDNGKIDVSAVSIGGYLEMRGKNGEMRIAQTTIAGDVTSITTNGRIDINTVTAMNAMLKTTNGKIGVHRLQTTGSINASGTNGEVLLSETVAEGSIDAYLTNGSVTLTHCRAINTRIETTNGGVTGNMAGARQEYQITFDTVNGRKTPAETGGEGPYTLYVKTINGNIHFTFE